MFSHALCCLLHMTVTVYEKGAEVVRMYKTLLGSSGFRRGMDLYFERHDGQAVTCEEFFAAMRDANDADFLNFLLWYSQAGTPQVKVSTSYNPDARTYSLKFSQEVPPTPGQPEKEPMFIPVVVGLLNSSGKDLPLSTVYHEGLLEIISTNEQPVFTTVLKVTKKEEEFVFSDVSERPIPSLLRGYSAPIRLDSDLTDSDLFFLLAHDSDEFNRWEAGQILARKLMLSLVTDVQNNKNLFLNLKFVDGIRSILLNSSLDKEFISKAITLPGEGEIMDLMEVADPDAVHTVRTFIRRQLALQLKEEFLFIVYSLIGGFCGSPVNFHAKDGSGYKFLGDIVLQLDKLNPQVASRMVSAFSRWRRYDEGRQALAQAELEKIMSANGLSENVYEIASKSLAA
ncbi:hypothetical protein KSP40_PGU009946 [Platanthera guangdongensis]|uniref:Puromycin-sensitive aminopeptidase n=1 Tax=Platanthera guangdongensis TaxID=2320717 RepID=A0ABR2M191_9ASPA